MTITTWNVDKAHSSIDFSVRHMMISKVKGSFTDFEASVEADPNDLTTATIEFKISTASVDTKNEDRDGHLRSADFFDVENHPYATFKATEIVNDGVGEYKVTGDFTLRGVTKIETFNVTFEGQGKNPWGAEVAGFTVEGKIKRSDYGLVWNAALETGGVLVGDEIKVSLEIEATK